MAGGFAGMACWGCIYPIDVIKSVVPTDITPLVAGHEDKTFLGTGFYWSDPLFSASRVVEVAHGAIDKYANHGGGAGTG